MRPPHAAPVVFRSCLRSEIRDIFSSWLMDIRYLFNGATATAVVAERNNEKKRVCAYACFSSSSHHRDDVPRLYDFTAVGAMSLVLHFVCMIFTRISESVVIRIITIYYWIGFVHVYIYIYLISFCIDLVWRYIAREMIELQNLYPNRTRSRRSRKTELSFSSVFVGFSRVRFYVYDPTPSRHGL